jgi:hypothetical protein
MALGNLFGLRKQPPKAAEEKPDGKAYSAPSVRLYTEWDPRKIKMAIQLAEQGNLTYAASLCEWLLTDDRVAGALSARTDALMGLTPTFELGSGRRAKRAARELEAGEDFWQAYPEGELTQVVTWGILLGVGPGQQRPWVANPDHAGRLLPTLTFWHPQTLAWDWYLQRWTVQDITGQLIEVRTDGGEWILHMPYGSTRPWAGGLWRSLARWVLLKQYALSDWARHGEKAATLVATAPEKATKEQRKLLAEDLAKAGEDRVVALANGFDLKLVEVSANTKEIYQAQVEMADLAIAIRVRGGNLSTSVSDKGSFAAAKQQAKSGDNAKLRFDASALSTTLHDQSLVFWAQFNFGDARLAPWPNYPVEPEEDKSQRATMVKTLAEGLTIMSALGFQILEKETKEEFGLSFLGKLEEPEGVPAPPAPGDLAPKPDDGGDDNQADDNQADEGDDAAGMTNGRALRAARARLASGARAEKTAGFVSGQLYVDDVVDDSGAAAGQTLTDTLLAELLDVIDGADSYDQIRERVTARYQNAEQPEALRTLLQHAFYLADLAGTAGAHQDA